METELVYCRGRRPLSRARLYTVVQEDCIHILCLRETLWEAKRSVAESSFPKRRATQERRAILLLISCSVARSISAIL